MQRRQSDIDRESVKDVASRLRQFEDHNLAIKLQEEEFNHHYDRNRSERRVMGVDTRKSKEEQELEKRFALEKRLAECREIASRDEAIARQIQEDLEAEERRLKQEQAILDQEIARRMQQRYEPPPIIPQPYEDDEHLAREMQERYFRRIRAAGGSLDEQTRNQLMHYVGRQTIPPDSLLPRSSDTQQRSHAFADDLGPPTAIPATYFPSSPSIAPSSTMILPNGLPPLPSYTEACTPTTPVLTNVTSSSFATSVRSSISPMTTQILTNTAAATQPARAPLHEIIPPPPPPLSQSSSSSNNNPNISSSANYSFLPSSPPSVANTNNNANNFHSQTSSASINNINNEFLQNLHPTNPFKESLEAQYRTHNPDSPINRTTTTTNNSQNEFGFPPFSDVFHAANNLPRSDQPSASSPSSR